MKLFVFIILSISITVSHQMTFPEIKEIWQTYVLKHSDICLEETGADYNLAMRLLPYGEYVDDNKLKCFLLCIANNLFITSEDGSVHHGNFLEVLNVKDAAVLHESDIVNKCFGIKSGDECSSFYAVSECIFRALEKIMPKE